MSQRAKAALAAPAEHVGSKAEPYQLVSALLAKLYRAEQLDALHLSIINLLDMVMDEEISLVLEQKGKTDTEKFSFLQKVVDSVHSPELHGLLEDAVHRKDLRFFDEKELGDLLRYLQKQAQQFVIVKLTVAVHFKEHDVWEFAALLSKKIDRPVVVSVKVEKDLIGGAIIQFGSYLSDFSIKTQLDIFRENWHKAVVETT